MDWSVSKDIVQIVIAVVGVVVALIAVLSAFRSGALKSLRIGSIELKASNQDLEAARSLIATVSSPHVAEEKPFEIEHLARYYAQILFQSKIAFWFSLIMATAGFFVIVAAALMYSSDKVGTTAAQGIAGIVVDAVAALFFVQSRRAQSSMTEFFDKLRRDRQQIESRRLCEEIHHPDARDALRIELSLYHAGLSNHDVIAEKIITACFRSMAENYKKDG